MYGGYLAAISHCIGCHTPQRESGQQLDRKRAFTGGRELPEYGHPGLTVSPNITADPENGIGVWSDSEVKRAVTRGIRPDGRRLSSTMPYEWYARLTPRDLDALVRYLRTLGPEKVFEAQQERELAKPAPPPNPPRP